MKGDTSFTGRKRIAHELGVSERTASRWRKKGVLEVKQFGGPTSPWRLDDAPPAPTGRSKPDRKL